MLEITSENYMRNNIKKTYSKKNENGLEWLKWFSNSKIYSNNINKNFSK